MAFSWLINRGYYCNHLQVLRAHPPSTQPTTPTTSLLPANRSQPVPLRWLRLLSRAPEHARWPGFQNEMDRHSYIHQDCQNIEEDHIPCHPLKHWGSIHTWSLTAGSPENQFLGKEIPNFNTIFFRWTMLNLWGGNPACILINGLIWIKPAICQYWSI